MSMLKSNVNTTLSFSKIISRKTQTSQSITEITNITISNFSYLVG